MYSDDGLHTEKKSIYGMISPVHTVIIEIQDATYKQFLSNKIKEQKENKPNISIEPPQKSKD